MYSEFAKIGRDFEDFECKFSLRFSHLVWTFPSVFSLGYKNEYNKCCDEMEIKVAAITKAVAGWKFFADKAAILKNNAEEIAKKRNFELKGESI